MTAMPTTPGSSISAMATASGTTSSTTIAFGQCAPKHARCDYYDVSFNYFEVFNGTLTMQTITEKDKKRFWDKVNVLTPDKCWEWKAYCTSQGYGHFGVNQIPEQAHRIAWTIVNGPIPEGKMICHTCDNKKCCNPNHLYRGDAFTNSVDRSVRNPESLKNFNGPKPKLHEGEIWLINKLNIPRHNNWATSQHKFSAKYVAKMFRVSCSTIFRIWNSPGYISKEGYVDFRKETIK